MNTSGMATPQSEKLRAINHLFERQLIKLTDRVFVAVGYGVSTFSFVLGTTGMVAVDSGSTPPLTAQALADLREHTDLPLVALVYTHGHPDHTGGCPGLLEENPDLEIWGTENFGAESARFARNNLTIAGRRGLRQAGFMLPPEKRINNGIAPAIYPRVGALAGGPSGGLDPKTLPTRTFGAEAVVDIAGVRLELSTNPGETEDQLLTWFPDDRVAFAGDNMYRSFPNMYAIRGTQYRDARDWCESVDRIHALKPDHLVLGHTVPFTGAAEVDAALTAYSAALWHVYNATIDGMNAGKTADELAQEITLPAELADLEFLGEYYGNISWTVRAICSGTLGWFDGNPTTMNPLHPAERAREIADLAGGVAVLAERAVQAHADGKAQWATELCDLALALDHDVDRMKLLKADALDDLAYGLVTATGRNYLHSCALELRSEVAGLGAPGMYEPDSKPVDD